MRSEVRKLLLTVIVCGLLPGGVGCVAVPRPFAETAAIEVENPILVCANDDHTAWETAVDVVHDYFAIARENRLDGVIETYPKVGASLFEPWHRDTVGVRNRLESTLQSIRRRAFIRVTRSEGGYLVGVEVFKELEDVRGTAPNGPGNATFQNSQPLQSDLNLVPDQSTPYGWLAQGRDPLVEGRMLRAIQAAYQRLPKAAETDDPRLP